MVGAGEEVPPSGRDAVSVEDLEDEAAVAHAELQDGHPVPGAAAAALRGDDAPLGVDADQELTAVPADLSEEGLDGVAGGRDGGPDHGAVVHDDVGVVRALHRRSSEGFGCCLSGSNKPTRPDGFACVWPYFKGKTEVPTRPSPI